MFEKIDRVNRLAKALKDSGMAKDMDEAVKVAEEMVDRGEESIKEASEHPSAEDLVEGETKVTAGEMIKEEVKKVEEALHIKKKEPEKQFEEREEIEELIEETEEERKAKLAEIKKEMLEIKEDIKQAEEDPNAKNINKIKEEIEELKKDVEEVEEE